MYKCTTCNKVLNELPKPVIRCPNCAGKVLVKLRKPVTKTIIAR